MRTCLIAVLFACLLPGPARADDAQSFVTGWLERCYAAADVAHAELRDARNDEIKDAEMKASTVEFSCGTSPMAICRHSADQSGCLDAATLWIKSEAARIVAELPRQLAAGQSYSSRAKLQRYYDFLESDGPTATNPINIEYCIGKGSAVPGLGFTRPECEVQLYSVYLSTARHYARQIASDNLK